MATHARGTGHLPGDDPDEIFDLVDECDRVIGRVRRGEAHRNPALIHRSVQVLVFGRDGRLLLQRRSSTKDLFPGAFCAAAAGHVAAGEGYGAAARRELEEELGIAPTPRFIGKRLVWSERETEQCALFIARSDGPFRFHPTEIAGGAFYALDEARERSDSGALAVTPALRVALDTLARIEREGRLEQLLQRL